MITLSSVLSLLVAAAITAPSAEVYTLQHCLDLARRQNPKLQMARLKQKAEAEKVPMARADYLPKVQAQGVYFNNLGQGPKGFFAQMVEDHSAVVNVSAIQPLTQLIKVNYAHRIALREREIAALDTEAARSEVEKNVKQLYWKALELKSQETAVEASLRFLDAKLADAQAAEKTGKVLADAVAEVEANLFEARKKQAEVEGGIDVVRSQLAVLMGLADDTVYDVAPDETVAPVAAGIEELERAAAADRAEVKKAQLDADRARLAVGLSKTNYIPDVLVSFGEFRQTGFPFLPVRNRAGGAVMSWTLFDWGKRESEIKQGKYMSEAARWQLRDQQDKVRLEVRQYMRAVETARRGLELSEAQLRLAAERLRITTDKNAVEKANQTDVLEARMRLAIAEAQAASARAEHNSRVADLERAIGK